MTSSCFDKDKSPHKLRAGLLFFYAALRKFNITANKFCSEISCFEIDDLYHGDYLIAKVTFHLYTTCIISLVYNNAVNV